MAIGERQVLSPSRADGDDEVQPRPGRRPWGRPIPWVSGGIIVAATLIFFMERFGGLPITGGLSPSEGGGGPGTLALYGPLIIERGQWWRCLTVVLEHGNAMHIFFNMWVVVTLGFTLERVIGSWRFLVISLVTALGASACALYLGFDKAMVGASGMILGWAGAMLPIATRTGRRSLGIWLFQIAVLSLIPGISWQGHLGGFLFGIPCGFALRDGAKRFAVFAPLLIAGGMLACYGAVNAHRPMQTPRTITM